MAEAPPLAFVDTNVWISAFMNPDGHPFRVVSAFLEEQFIPVTSQSFIDELRTVRLRHRIQQRFRLPANAIETILARLEETSIRSEPTGNFTLCRDPKDNILLETAILGGARYLVSRDDDMKRDLDLIANLQAHGIEYSRWPDSSNCWHNSDPTRDRLTLPLVVDAPDIPDRHDPRPRPQYPGRSYGNAHVSQIGYESSCLCSR
jgi:putative PIN family toxin of toxin-antitoxin system